MANIIALFIDIATDQRTPQMPECIIDLPMFLENEKRLISLMMCVLFLKFVQSSKVLHVAMTFTFNQLFRPPWYTTSFWYVIH